MKTLHITSLIAIAFIVFASSCSDPSSEILPTGSNGIENRDPGNNNTPDDSGNNRTKDNHDNGSKNNPGTEDNNSERPDSEDNQTGCGIKISSSELPSSLRTLITDLYTQKAPYYYIKRAEVCKENGKITKYIVTLSGPNALTLNFDADGSPIN